MYCPDCGTQTLAEHEFCRSCGASLRTEARRSFARLPVVGVILAFTGILIALLGSSPLLHQQLVTYIGVIISILGMMSIALAPMLASNRSRERTRRIPNMPQELTPADTTTKLPPISARDQFPSVVEDTTELLREPVPGQIRR